MHLAAFAVARCNSLTWKAVLLGAGWDGGRVEDRRGELPGLHRGRQQGQRLLPKVESL